MNSRVYPIIVSLFASVFIVGTCSAAELSDAARGRVSEFLDIVLAEPQSLEHASAGPESAYRHSVREVVGGTPVVRLRADSWHATANGNTGEIYSFGRNQAFEEEKEVALTLGLKDAVPREVIIDTYLKLCDFYGVPAPPDSYRVRLVDRQALPEPAIPKDERNLYLSYWDIRRELTYKGYPVRDRHLNAAISPVSGRITLVSYLPVVVPDSDEWEETPSEAVDAVRSWLGAKPYFSEKLRPSRLMAPSSSILEKVIACPRQFPEERLSREERMIPPNAYYCWEVPFEYQESGHWFSAVAWVTAGDGEVIGWNNDLYSQNSNQDSAEN